MFGVGLKLQVPSSLQTYLLSIKQFSSQDLDYNFPEHEVHLIASCAFIPGRCNIDELKKVVVASTQKAEEYADKKDAAASMKGTPGYDPDEVEELGQLMSAQRKQAFMAGVAYRQAGGEKNMDPMTGEPFE
ncbi:uncharacterized protein MELLADRAFT_112418 [Melampsora larici-populina 98AG31]|uniref:Uncharacterized protein n=1 Tax=Melampsora larici-populina (strain 98AG31 / pathotype 3-4-7) TaxID=747676 RepID=F4S6E8_MELLP|nr:uncharacterized protein MELLADRAFT_112418 [Melampsora larici-populina 98AG31]EGF99806.1 hypothetical protein MELLADRAFT_112418 [Melampsora larici-populina 98AG31]